MGFLDVLGGAGRGVLGGLEDVGRGLMGQQPYTGMGGQQMADLAKLIPDEFTRQAFLKMAQPSTQQLLGGLGRVPVLGPVLGTGLDVLSTLQAARHGGLGRELAARGIAGALPFSALGDIATAAKTMEGIRTQQAETRRTTLGGDEITDRIKRNQQETNAELRFKDAQTIASQATGENAKAAARANLAQADLYRQQTASAARYPGELPPGTDPKTIRIIGGKPVVDTPRGPMVLPNAPKPGAPGEVKPPPMGAMTKEQAQAKVAAYPPEARAQMRELPGRPGFFTVETVPIDAGGERRRVVGLEALEKMMPGALPFSGEDFRDPTTREKGNAILQQITGRPHDIGQLLDENGRLDREKVGKFLQEQKDMDAARDALIY